MIPEPGNAYREKLAAVNPPVAELTLQVRAMVLEEAAGAFEHLYPAGGGVAVSFSFTGKAMHAFIHVVAYDTWVLLGFNDGAALADPGRALRGDAARSRHIRISSQNDAERGFVRRFVQEAVKRAVRPEAVILTEPKPLVRGNYVRKKRITGGVRGSRRVGSKPA